MGFCTKEEYGRFLHQCPIFERLLVEDGILLRKYWFSVSDEEQERRFRSRLDDPMRRWKLSAMDLESITRWEDYSRAKDEMFVHTDIPEAPWYVVDSADKRRARLNMIAHLLSTVSYHDVQRLPLELPPRPKSTGYVRAPRDMQTFVPDYVAALLAGRVRSSSPVARTARGSGRVVGRDHARELAGRHHGDVAVGQPLDDVGRRAVCVRDADDEARPGLVALDDEPVAHMCIHNGSPHRPRHRLFGASPPACPAGAIRQRADGLAAGTFATAAVLRDQPSGDQEIVRAAP